MEKIRKLAEEDVRKSLQRQLQNSAAANGDVDNNKKEELDPYLVNTNINTRMMKAWEALTKEQREAYMVHEEDDRRRFMEEDEIASRHCATLTARGKSPATNVRASTIAAAASSVNSAAKQQYLHDKVKNEEDRQESESSNATSPDRELLGAESICSVDENDNEARNADDGDNESPKRPKKGDEDDDYDDEEEEEEEEDDDEDKELKQSPAKRRKVGEELGDKEAT
jgi:hypothetical protein